MLSDYFVLVGDVRALAWARPATGYLPEELREGSLPFLHLYSKEKEEEWGDRRT